MGDNTSADKGAFTEGWILRRIAIAAQQYDDTPACYRIEVALRGVRTGGSDD